MAGRAPRLSAGTSALDCDVARRASRSLELGPAELASWFEANRTKPMSPHQTMDHCMSIAEAASSCKHTSFRSRNSRISSTRRSRTSAGFSRSCKRTSSGRGQSDIERTREGLLRTVRRRDEVYSFAARADLGARTTSRANATTSASRASASTRALRTPRIRTRLGKDEASTIFARYKKANSALPRVAARRQVLEREHAELETLAWEIERADQSRSTRSNRISTARRKSARLRPRHAEKSSRSTSFRSTPLHWPLATRER